MAAEISVSVKKITLKEEAAAEGSLSQASVSVKKITLKEEAAAEGSLSQASEVVATEGSSSQASEVAATEGSSSQASEVAATEGSSSQASEVVATELSASEESATEVPALVKKITLISSDGVEFVIDENVAVESQTIKHMIEDDCADSDIPLPNVSSKILTKVIEYSKKHVESPTKAIAEMAADKAAIEELKTWDAEFVKVDQGTLFQMILAANYLNIKGLLELTCERVADMMRGKTPEEIRALFGIKNDYTPEEEEEVRRANQWAFD